MDPSAPLQPYIPPANNLGPANDVGAPLNAPMPSSGQQPMQPMADPLVPYSPPPQMPIDKNAPLVPPITNHGNPSALNTLLPQQPMPMAQAQTGDQPGPVQQEVIEKLRQANNVLVTVSKNPSVDQLSSAIATTLVLNKLDKHATAVFSGAVPSTIEFLQPEKTIEKTTDSLRDFIIALDKSKADKLRYKVEDQFVKIFITPYHTSLSQEDLEFSQGDFNVDVVVAIGVHQREELDEAITAHGRILHDAVVITVNNKNNADIGSLNWFDPQASSLCEMLVSIIEPLQGNKTVLDEQVATAFLTGVVAETERFSNDKTTPHTMNVSALLMKAGANQQLVANKLEEPKAIPKEEDFDSGKLNELAKENEAKKSKADGSLEISHKEDEPKDEPQAKQDDSDSGKSLSELEAENEESEYDPLDKIHIDDEGRLHRVEEAKKQEAQQPAQAPSAGGSQMILQPPTLGSPLSANDKPEVTPPSVNPMAETSKDSDSMTHAKSLEPLSNTEKTLSQIEESVDSPHIQAADDARKAVADAHLSDANDRPAPVQSLNAQPIDLGKSPEPTSAAAFPEQLVKPVSELPKDPTAGSGNPTPPPPVPPPFMPPTAS